MREGLPSVTAAFVAFARGVASNPGLGQPVLKDDLARRLVPFPLGLLVPRRDLVGARAAQGLLRAASLGLVDHLAMRSLAIDAAVDSAIADGARQLVILGAGLDARAHRLESLQDTRVFEVDHPASQAYKKRRASGMPTKAREVIYVAQDFTRETLESTLSRAGHDRSMRTVWICEGVTMYLAPSDTRALFETVAARSAPGSRLAVTYLAKESYPVPKPLRALVELPLTLFGEPFRGALSKLEIAELATRVGFHVANDSSSRTWAVRHRGASAAAFRSERLLIADRKAD